MKKWKKIVLRCCIALGVLVILLIGAWRISLGLYASTLKGNPEKLLAYEEKADGTLTITGLKPDGFLRDTLGFDDLQLDNDTYGITIPEKIDGKTVTEIGAYAFLACENLKTIEFPDSVTTIGFSAFSGCGSLEKIDFPAGTTIGAQAFLGCNSLEKIEFPDGIAIGEMAFSHCENLGRIEFPEFPNDAISIGDYAFEFCRNLVTVKLPRSVSSMGKDVFRETFCIRGTFRIPEGTTTIDEMFVAADFSDGDAIYSEMLLEIWIPNTVTMIDEKFLGQHGVCGGEHRCVFYAETGSYAASWLKEHEERITKGFIPDENYKEAIVIY